MNDYRWNQADLAAGYDAGASLVHPYYMEVQNVILNRLSTIAFSGDLVVDLGGGSGRLVERILERWPQMTALIIDQSESFLELARARLHRFGDRVDFRCYCLQDDWRGVVPKPAGAIVSMSAIHHLDPAEKRECYQRCFETLTAGGLLLNGDEVRAESDLEYRTQVETWATHMEQLIATSAVSAAMADGLRKWRQRNLVGFGEPRRSGDDCHETTAAQLRYFADAGFVETGSIWSRDLWTVLAGRKPREIASTPPM